MIKGDLKSQVAQCVMAQWAIGAGTLLLCTVIALMGIRPVTARLGALQRHAAVQHSQLAANRERAASLAPLQRETEQLHQQVKAFDQRLGRASEFPQFIQDVSNIAHKSSLRNLTWRSDAQQTQVDQMTELPIQFSFQSEYAGMSDFLSQVANLQRLTRVRKVAVKALPGADGSAGWVDVQLTMNVYFGDEQ
jgi:Tfp pilus assembly protein PilO